MTIISFSPSSNWIIPFILILIMLTSLTGTYASKMEENNETLLLFQQGVNEYKAGNLTGALDLLDKAIEQSPDIGEIHKVRGYVLMTKGDSTGSLDAFTKILELHPDDGEAAYQAAIISYGADDFPAAADRFAQAAASGYKVTDSKVMQGFSLLSSGDAEGGLNSFNDALEINSVNNLANYGKGQALSALMKYDQATLAYQAALQDNANDVLVLSGKANAHLALNQFGQASSLYQMILDIQPDDYSAMLGKGISDLRQNKFQDAADILKTVVEKKTDDGIAWYNYGKALEGLGKESEAKSALQQAASYGVTSK